MESRFEQWQRWALYVLLGVLGILTAVCGALLVPYGVELVHQRPPAAPAPTTSPGEPLAALLTAGFGLRLSFGVVAAVASNLTLTVGGAWSTGTTAGAVVPGLTWLATAVYLGNGRTEGDLVLTNSWSGLLFILLGALAAAVGIGLRPRRAGHQPRSG